LSDSASLFIRSFSLYPFAFSLSARALWLRFISAAGSTQRSRPNRIESKPSKRSSPSIHLAQSHETRQLSMSTNNTDSNGCLICPAPAPCNCQSDQQCVTTVRLCQQCPVNKCIGGSSNSGSNGSSGGGGSNVGATVGPVIGGLAAGAVVAALLWYFWWRPRKASLRAANKARTTNEKTPPASSTAQSPNDQPDIVVKRSSVHLSGPSEANRRISAALPSPPAADDPFGDHHSMHLSAPSRVLSTATSDPSIYSSRSPTYSSRPSTSESLQRSASQISRDGRSPGAESAVEVINMSALPHDKNAPPRLGPLPKSPVPVRPDRSPDLDLRLPDLSVKASPSDEGARPQSGFPWSSPSPTPDTYAPSPAPKVSHFSASTVSSTLTPDDSSRSQSHLSTYSMSSEASHMSYILDPPQVGQFFCIA
jgi:hypothetical protein